MRARLVLLPITPSSDREREREACAPALRTTNSASAAAAVCCRRRGAVARTVRARENSDDALHVSHARTRRTLTHPHQRRPVAHVPCIALSLPAIRARSPPTHASSCLRSQASAFAPLSLSRFLARPPRLATALSLSRSRRPRPLTASGARRVPTASRAQPVRERGSHHGREREGEPAHLLLSPTRPARACHHHRRDAEALCPPPPAPISQPGRQAHTPR